MFVARHRSDPWFDAECRDAKRLTRRAHIAAIRGSATTANKPAAASLSLLPSPPNEAAWYEQRRRLRELLNQKRIAYWQSKIEADRHLPKILWATIDKLLGRGRQQSSAAISVNEFSRFFEEKVDKVRRQTDNCSFVGTGIFDRSN